MKNKTHQHVDNIIMLGNEDTAGSQRITVRSIKDDVVNATGFNPDDKYSFLQLDLSDEEIQRRGKILDDASSLSSKIRSTYYHGDSTEEAERTMPARYKELVECIEEYYKSDDLVKLSLAPSLNRAITSMNREQLAIDEKTYDPTDAEKNLRKTIDDIQYRSIPAHDEILKVFETYRQLDESEQKAILPDVQNLYRSYMAQNPDSVEMKESMRDEYYSLPKTFTPNLTFDTSHLQNQNLTHDDNQLISDLSHIDGAKLSYRNLESLMGYHVSEPKKDASAPDASAGFQFETIAAPKDGYNFANLSQEQQSITYNEYLRILNEYQEAHPRSKHAVALEDHLRDMHYETVANSTGTNLIDSVRQLDAFGIAQRSDAIKAANDLLDKYSELPDGDRAAYRGIVQEAIEKFNDHELHKVVVPKYEDFLEYSSYPTTTEMNQLLKNYSNATVEEQQRSFAELVENYKAYSSTRHPESMSEQFNQIIDQLQAQPEAQQALSKFAMHYTIADMESFKQQYVLLTASEKDDVMKQLQEACKDSDIKEPRFVNNATVKFEHAVDSYFSSQLGTPPTGFSKEEAAWYTFELVDPQRAHEYKLTNFSDLPITVQGKNIDVLLSSQHETDKMAQDYAAAMLAALNNSSAHKDAVEKFLGTYNSDSIEDFTHGAFVAMEHDKKVEAIAELEQHCASLNGFVPQRIDCFYVSQTLNKHFDECGKKGLMEQADAALYEQILTSTPAAANYDTNTVLLRTMDIVQKEKVNIDSFLGSDVAKRYAGISSIDDLRELVKQDTLSYIEKLQITQELSRCCADAGIQCEVAFTPQIITNVVEDVKTHFEKLQVADEVVEKIGKVLDVEKQRLEPAEQFKANVESNLENFKTALDERNGIVYPSKLSDLQDAAERFHGTSDKSFTDEVKGWLAASYTGKVERFYHSGEQETQFFYSGFINEEGKESKQVNLQVDEIVNKHCFIGHVPGSDEHLLVITKHELDFGIQNDDKDSQHTLSGIRIVNSNELLDKNAEFLFTNNKILMQIPEPASDIGPNYEIGTNMIKRTYEVLDITEKAGAGSTFTLLDTKTQQIIELNSSLTYADATKQVVPDLSYYTDSNVVVVNSRSTPDTIIQYADASFDSMKNQVIQQQMSRFEMDDLLAKNMIQSPEAQNFNWKMHDGQLYVAIDGVDKEVIGYKLEDDKLSALVQMSDDTCMEIADLRSFKDVCQSVQLTNSEVTIGNPIAVYGFDDGGPQMSWREGFELKHFDIAEVKDRDGKATLVVFDKDGNQKTFCTDWQYDDARLSVARAYYTSGMCPSQTVSTDDLSYAAKNDGKIYYSYTDTDHVAHRGAVISISVDQQYCILASEEGFVKVNNKDIHQEIMSGIDVVTSKQNMHDMENRHVFLGNGAVITDLAKQGIPQHNYDLEIVKPENTSKFLESQLSTEHNGNAVILTTTENHKTETSQILFMNAHVVGDDNINMTILTQSKDKLIAYQLDNVSFEEFIRVTQCTKLSEQTMTQEQKDSLERLTANEHNRNDVENVVAVFNQVKPSALTANDFPHVPQPGDISLARVVERDGETILYGKNHEDKAVTLVDPIIKTENNELIVYSTAADGSTQRNRIVSSAFGSYDDLHAAMLKEFDWANVAGQKQVYNNVDIEYTVKVDLSADAARTAGSMKDLFVEKVGLSCINENGQSFSAKAFEIMDDTRSVPSGMIHDVSHMKVAPQLGVIIKDDEKSGPSFAYYNTDQESNLYSITKVGKDGGHPDKDWLDPALIPKTPQDAQDNKFVLVDYDKGVVIHESGRCYAINPKALEDFKAELGDKKPQNYYVESIAKPFKSLKEHANFVSEEKFNGSTIDIKPVVNNWSIGSSGGRFTLSFDDMSMSDTMGSTIGKSYEIKSINVKNNGIEAEVVVPMDNTSNTSKEVQRIRLAMPSDEQFRAMEAATANVPCTDPVDRINAYFDMINLANGKDLNANNNVELRKGDVVAVQGHGESKGVLYECVDNKGSLMIVGNTDNPLLHPALLTKDDLENKTVAVVDLPTDAKAKLRFATETIYAEVNPEVNSRGLPTGKSSVTVGENDTASDSVVGVTYYGCDTRPAKEPEVTVDESREL